LSTFEYSLTHSLTTHSDYVKLLIQAGSHIR